MTDRMNPWLTALYGVGVAVTILGLILVSAGMVVVGSAALFIGPGALVAGMVVAALRWKP